MTGTRSSPGRTTWRATRGLPVLLAAAGVVYLLARVVGDEWLVLVAATLATAPISAFLLTPRFTAVDLAVAWPTPVAAGELFRVRVTVANRSRRALPPLWLAVGHEAVDGCRKVVAGPRPGGATVVELVTCAPRRGCYTDAVYQVEIFAPLGLVGRRRTWRMHQPLVVHPAPAAPLAVGGAGGSTGDDAQQVVVGGGVEVNGLRAWRPGDAARAVHWRTTARTGRLQVLEREDPVGGALVVEAGPAGTGPAWEHAVARTAATVVAALRAGTEVHLYDAHSGGTLRPLSFREALDWFAALGFEAPGSAPPASTAAGSGPPVGTVLWLAGIPPRPARGPHGRGYRMIDVGALAGGS